jgi:hypothetical protein
VNKICLPVSICALFFLGGHSFAATFTVTNTNDSGTGSLRQAINDATAAPTSAHDNVIAFSIPGTGLHTIRPVSSLPPLKDVLVDGYTQAGSSANTLATGTNAVLTIELDGTNAGATANGLVNLGAPQGTGIPNATVRGLIVNRFGGSGMRVSGPGGSGFPGYLTVQGCYIGTDASGAIARGNGIGIEFANDGQGVIGEPTADFAGNTTPFPAYRNVISGNVGAGVAFTSTDALNSAVGTVRNAYIGTDAAGLAAVGNGGDGVSISGESAFGTQNFGTSIYLYDNVIAANAGDGIDTQGVGTQVVGNTIGSGVDGRALGNQGNGAYFHNGSIGALSAVFGQQGAPGPGVAHNAGAGVLISDASIVDVTGPIYSNVGLGIDLSPAGPTANDVGDADTGPNEKLNYPVITSAAAVSGGAGTRIQGTINSRPNSQVEVHLYMNASCNPSGNGEGQRSLGSVVGLTTDSSGDATFDKQLNFTIDTNVFPKVTAQSRRFAEGAYALPSPIEVSEYSPCFTVTGSAPLPTLGINDVSVTEGDSGTTTASFTVTLSAAAAGAVTVNYATADGTAAAGTDYVAGTGTLTFSAGQLTRTVSVTINGDAAVEPNEAFVVNLSAASGATIADAQGAGTIMNDDVAPLPTLSIANVSVAEGNSGTSTASFTVTLSAAATAAVTVNYATADGTAAAGTDYVSATGTLSFAVGETTKSIAVTVNGDTTVEPGETFALNLSAASGATIATASATGTITNDDVAPPPGGGGGGGGGAMDPWLLGALGFCVVLVSGRRRKECRVGKSA